MADWKEVGEIEKIAPYTIEWSINDLLALHVERYFSPTFCVEDDSWFLEINYRGAATICIQLCRVNKMPGSNSVEYTLFFKISKGCINILQSGILKENDIKSRLEHQIRYFTGSLVIQCSLRREIHHHFPPILATDETKPMKLISLDRLSEKLKNLFSIKETCDTTLKVQNNEYKAHSAILIAQSPVFAAMFMHDTTERQTGVINITDCDPDSFQVFLEYLYSGKLEEISSTSALHLYVTSDKYEVLELKAFCVNYLKQCLTVENICEIVAFADKYDEAELYSAVQDFFNKNISEIIETSEWESLLKEDYRLANKLLKMKYRK